MNAAKSILFAISALILGGCAGPSVSMSSRIDGQIPAGKIGLAPGGGVLADAIGVELFQRGFDTMDSTESPANIAAVHAEGIDTLLIVKAIGGYDSLPEAATIRIVQTSTGKTIAAINWQNGHGGMAGSIADRTMREGLVGAAQQIVDQLSLKLSK
jgi:hypothetical protein